MNMGNLKIKVFADGAEIKSMVKLARHPYVKGFTTNPSLMRQAGVTDYKNFAEDVLAVVKGLPISLEVFADDMYTMYEQAKKISELSTNVIVKIPVVNSQGESMAEVISSLGNEGIPLNLTAIMTERQVENLLGRVNSDSKLILSIFAGRIADTGRNPSPIVESSVKMVREFKNAEVLWASTREVYNIIQAEEAGCHIITMPYSLIKKMDAFGKDLNEYSRETAETFFQDALNSGYKI